MKKILFIEDDEDKREKVTAEVAFRFPDVSLDFASSFNTGLRMMIRNKSYSVVLLDMSVPNFDHKLGEPSEGPPESYAGKEILMQMKLRGISIPTIVVTMFDSFGDGESRQSAKELDEELMRAFSPSYLGMVYYNSAQEGWRSKLTKMLEGVIVERD